MKHASSITLVLALTFVEQLANISDAATQKTIIIVNSKADAVAQAKLNLGPLSAGGLRYELPAAPTGTGPHDFYSLFTKLSFGASGAVYGIGVATDRKQMSSKDAQFSAGDGNPLNIELRQQLPARGHKIEYIEAKFDRRFLERAAANGTRFSLRSSRGSMQFAVPNWMFGALLEVADEHDFKKKTERAAQAKREAAQQRRQSYLDAHPETTERIKEAITTGTLALGMSDQQARASWGAPEKINRTVNVQGVHEQWIYESTYVYFDDGVLTSWQDSR